jgi:hypothetical protein
MRASDGDREATAHVLREHFAAGRLTETELDERLAAAYEAREDSELAALTHDLPALPLTPAERSRALAERRGHLQRRLLQESGGGIALFTVCVVVWLTSGAHGFWPIWVLIFVVIPLLRGAWRLYGPAPDFDRLERELDERRRRDRRGRARDASREELRRRSIEAHLDRHLGPPSRRRPPPS